MDGRPLSRDYPGSELGNPTSCLDHCLVLRHMNQSHLELVLAIPIHPCTQVRHPVIRIGWSMSRQGLYYPVMRNGLPKCHVKLPRAPSSQGAIRGLHVLRFFINP